MPTTSAKRTRPTPPKKANFDLRVFLDTAGVERQIVKFGKSETIYSQGDPGRGVNYIQEGGVRLSVVNEDGKEAVVALLGPGDFFGEGAWQVSRFAWGRPPR